MKRTFSPFGILTFTLALIGFSASTASAAGTACVWRVTNAKAPFYLVGTMHALSGSDYPLRAPYKEAIRNSQRFVFEFDPNRDNEFSKKFDVAARYPKGQDIRSHIHPQTYQYLARSFRISNANPNAFLPYKPWAIAGLWGIRGYADIRSAYGVDNFIEKEARRAHKEIAGIETVDEHVEVMSGMSNIESELILLDSITRYNKDLKRNDYRQMHAAWRRGDVATMWACEQRGRHLNPGGEARLLDLRNVKWVPRIRAEINSGKPTAIVVGAGHMLGPNGVIALLQRNGYKFEQL
jgi:uncharacterized protein YbaP (TraB family)